MGGVKIAIIALFAAVVLNSVQLCIIRKLVRDLYEQNARAQIKQIDLHHAILRLQKDREL